MKVINYFLAASVAILAASCSGGSSSNNNANTIPTTFAGANETPNATSNGSNTQTASASASTPVSLTYLSDSEADNAAATAKAKGNVLYVNKATGGNRNDGTTPEQAFKNLQKAIDQAQEGSVILVAEGNYIGTLDCGNINIDKPLTIMGGFSSDFTKRDVLKYQTTVETTSTSNGTAKGQGTMTIDVNAAGKTVTIDGLIFNQGNAIAYNPKKEGQPEGVESPMMQPVGGAGIGGPDMTETNVFTNRMAEIYFNNPTCDIVITNCAFVNGSNYGVLGMFKGKAVVKNNIFVNIVMAAIDIRGSYASKPGGQRSVVEFDHNSVLFTWSRTKAFEDMGYGIRFMPITDYYCTNNIFGFSVFAGMDRTHVDSNAKVDKERITTSVNNLFCFNKQADLTIPGGGMFMRVKAEDFDDVETLTDVKGNKTISDANVFNNRLDKAYVNGFLTASYTESTDYDPNSPANQWRASMGMNQVGTMQSSATMFANRYNLQKALMVFGAVENYGAQTVK